VKQIVDLGTPDIHTNSVVVATVGRIVVHASVLDGTAPGPDALGLVGRMGGGVSARTTDRFELPAGSRDPASVIAAPRTRAAEPLNPRSRVSARRA